MVGGVAVDAVEEVVDVLLCVEAQHVGAEQPLEDLAAPREDPEERVRWPRDMAEPADARAAPLPAQQAWHEHQVIVLDPHRVGGLARALHGLREEGVRGAVFVPGRLGHPDSGGEAVQERPEDGVAHAHVEALLELRGDAHVGELVPHVGSTLDRVEVLGVFGAHPHAAPIRQHRVERGDQAAGRAHPTVSLPPVGPAVADDDEFFRCHDL